MKFRMWAWVGWWLVAQVQAQVPVQTLEGRIECGPSVSGQPAYSQTWRMAYEQGLGQGLTEDAHVIENQELVVEPDGRVRYNAIGLFKNQPERRWRIHASGRVENGRLQASGAMYAERAQDLVRARCTIESAAPPLPAQGERATLRIQTVGEPLGTSPSTLTGGATFREWGLERGLPWSLRVAQFQKGRRLDEREPSRAESFTLDAAWQVLQGTRTKALVWVDGSAVVAALARPGIEAETLLPSASMSKSLTALGVGQALCAGHLRLDDEAKTWLPELAGTPLGQARLRDILRMASGASETEKKHTHGFTFEETRDVLWARSVRELVSLPRNVQASAKGRTFDYKSTDPYLAALMVQAATGQPFTRWLHEQLLVPAGVSGPYVLDTDRQGNFLATGGVRLSLVDWIRLGVFIREQRDQNACLGQFVREMGRAQWVIPKIEGVNGYFGGYGYFSWTDNDRVPQSVWAVGSQGQRLGWSTRAGDPRLFLAFGDGTDPDMGRIYPLAQQWLNR